MSIKAGTTLTTAHLSHTTKHAQLSDEDPSTTSEWVQWGDEEIVIPDPGIDVEVTATLIGRLVDNDSDAAAAASRVKISLDGGDSWTEGDGFFIRVGTDVGVTCTTANTMSVSGTPDGDIIVRAEFHKKNAATSASDGTITATMIPAG